MPPPVDSFSPPTPTPKRRSLAGNLFVIFITRSLLNTAYRAPYPFLPFITRDLGLSLEAAGGLITFRNFIGLSAPLFGPLSDRYGRVTVMAAGLLLVIIGCLTIGITYSIILLALALAIVTVGKTLYDPAQQAYLGDRVPYAERGRALALSELSWSSAGLIGLPLAGALITLAGWRSPFLIIAVLSVGALVLTWRALERVSPPGSPTHTHMTWRARGQLLSANPTALAALSTSFLMAAGNENINVVYSTWANRLFNLDAAALGLIAGAIGLAEFVGELASSVLVDRLGKKRTVLGGLVLTALAAVGLPFLDQSEWAVAIGLFAMFLAFEFALVSSLPLITELVPQARATFISFNVAAFLLARAVGAFTGSFVFARFGFIANGLVSAGFTLLGVFVWQVFVREHHT